MSDVQEPRLLESSGPVVFAYSFPHAKTYFGLMRLLTAGLTPALVWAADKIDLNLPESLLRTTVRGLDFPTAEEVCKQFSIPYINAPHNLAGIPSEFSHWRFNTGVILGARILPEEVIRLFDLGILNMHPGLLPDNRGLDNLKWAILGRLPQGVTLHIIDSSIDRGWLIRKKILEVYPDDTLIDIQLRLANTELSLMIDFFSTANSGREDAHSQPLASGQYHSVMPASLEEQLETLFQPYKTEYSKIVTEYLSNISTLKQADSLSVKPLGSGGQR